MGWGVGGGWTDEKNVIIIKAIEMWPISRTLTLQLLLLLLSLRITNQQCATYASCDQRCNGYCSSASAVTNYDCCNGCNSGLVFVTGIGSSYYYRWPSPNSNTCSNYCPPGYYVPTTPGAYCPACHIWCATCVGGNTNVQCTACASTAYQYNSSACYNYVSTDQTYGKANPCLNGYYGLQITKTCVACPTGCATCSIELTWEMPGGDFGTTYNQHGINCTGDSLCGYTLRCWSCKSGYTLINGLCASNQACMTYSKYTSSGATFSSTDCKCFENYQWLAISICYKCHITCLTCSGTTSSTCVTCPSGLNATSGACSYNTTYSEIVNWVGGTPALVASGDGWSKNVAGPVAGVVTTNCDAGTYVFGYYGYNLNGLSYYAPGTTLGANLFPAGATLTYTKTTGVPANHYGINVRGTLLFIDQWKNGLSILFKEGGYNRFQFDYQMEDIVGEYLCGLNYYDHLDVFNDWFTHSATTIGLSIQATTAGYAWGIKEIVMHVLLCHTSCSTCDGPLISDCLSCPTNQKVANGYCVCNDTAGYYNNSGTCTNSCPAPTVYQHPSLFACVSSCSFPYPFGYYNSTTTKYDCVITCPSGYKYYTNYTCQTACYNSSNTVITTNYFNFDGKDKACYNICPNGTYGDPVSGSCVRECPAYNATYAATVSRTTSDGYFSSGNFCYESCPSGWAYPPQRACLTTCPSGYYKNYLNKGTTNSSICEQKCGVSLKGQYLYGDNSTGTCVNYCPAGTYGDIQTHLCVAYCNSSAFGQTNTTTGGVLRVCAINCSLGDGLFGNPLTGMCVTALNCPSNYYGDPLTFQCTRKCSGALYFGDNSTKLCTTSNCANRGFRQNDTKICVKTCVNNDTTAGGAVAPPEYGDPLTWYCVAKCYGSYYADRQYNMECVQTCSASPTSTFGLASALLDDNVCVINCSSTTWADPYHVNRICTTSCTNNAVNETYGLNDTRTCVFKCPDWQFAHNVSGIPLCTPLCTNDSGLYGNILNNRCQAQCPSPYYGDQTRNRTCVLKCPWPYYARNCTMSGSTIVISADRVCALDCAVCGWADNSSQTCAWDSSGCANFTFAHESNHRCVVALNCTGFADPLTRNCVPTCFDNTTHRYFGDPSTKDCVLVCPLSPNYFGDNFTHQCVGTCSNSEIRDPQYMRRCVALASCSRTPVALFGDATKLLCVTALNCTDGFYGDNNTKTCIAVCPGGASFPTLLYADNVTKQCVAMCELGWYALNQTLGKGICTQFCPPTDPLIPTRYLWADNYTVTCTSQCSPKTYGVNYTQAWTTFNQAYTVHGVCKKECPVGQFARDADNLCVTNCGINLWGDTISRTCKTSPFDCPAGYYADNFTHMCVVPLDCSNYTGGVLYVADNTTKFCVNKCPPINSTFINYADMTKRLCVAQCPANYYGFNTTLTCNTACKFSNNNSYEGSYADPQINICVAICMPQPRSTFGENVTFTCVEARDCPALRWAEVTVYNRQCVPYCPAPNVVGSNPRMYADNYTKTCVTTCPTYAYADLSKGYGMCVQICPNLTNGTRQFADNSTKTCVMVCPAGNGTWGDNTTQACVITCPVGSYAQPIPYRYCVAKCAVDTWGEDIKRTCVSSPLECPTVNGSHYYAENVSTMCVKMCPSTPDYWGENTTRMCLSSCLLPSGVQSGFKWNTTRVCIDECPAEIGQDGSYSDQGMCYYICITAGYYRDPQYNRSCQDNCTFAPVKQYADDTTWRCLAQCPTYPQQYYAYDADKKCLLTCPSTTRKYEPTKQCVDVCPVNTFYNADTDQCLDDCPSNTNTNTSLYGDATLAEPQCVLAVDCPAGYYGDDNVGLCVDNCTMGQWIYGKNCVVECPNGFFGNFDTLECVLPADCPTDYFADDVTVTCVDVCSGSFGDPNTHSCVDICPVISGTPFYADSYTRKCATTCTNNATVQLHENLANLTCVSRCNPNLFLDTYENQCLPNCTHLYYADNSTRVCVSVCPSSPYLFGENNTYTCVQSCPLTTEYKYVAGRVCVTSCPSGYFRENVSRTCVNYCPNTTYADSVLSYCVYNCSPNYAYDDTNKCQASCPTPYFKDPTTFKCVFNCPTYPTSYFQVITVNDRRCDTTCPTGQYRDFTTYLCVSICPPSPATYADNTTGSCLAVCSPSYYAYSVQRTCVSACVYPLFADPLTRTCVAKCDPMLGYFGDRGLSTPACVAICSSGTYADPFSQECVSSCKTYPKMYAFDNGQTTNAVRQCVYSCPYPYQADNTTSKCILNCNSTALPFIDQALQMCVAVCSSPVYQYSYLALGTTANGECVKFCPNGTFAHLSNNSCVFQCPSGFYGSTSNNTCFPTCSLANGEYADPIGNLCVTTCTHNDTYFSYADEYSRTCVTVCPADKATVGDQNNWKCVKRCTLLTQYADPTTGTCVDQCSPGLFADNTTQTCISNCSLYTLMYGDEDSRVCVSQCLLTTLYADDSTRLCVNSTSCPAGYFGLNSSRSCVAKCPTSPDLFGDSLTKTCEAVCSASSNVTYFADPSTRTCVSLCPAVPALFARNNTLRCVDSCPANSYADNYTRYCIAVCSTIPIQTFADNTTNQCVAVCPTEPDYYASNYTWECVLHCPSSPPMYADNSTRSCVQYCPRGDISTFAEEVTRRCVDICPGSTYNENSTHRCLANCSTGYADPKSKYCVAICPKYSYGSNNTMTCVTGCPVVNSVQTYAEDYNNLCMVDCLAVFNTYRDPYTKRCVRICPISQGYFADPSRRLCVDQCPASPLTFADNSTRYCVAVCPSIPALFAINNTRVCTAVCPNGTWASNNTRICLDLCLTVPETFGDNSTWTCVSRCPTKPNLYADDSTHTCVPVCPTNPDYYADNITRKCILQCPNNTFADPTTRRCVTTCPNTYYAQNSSRRCVQACPWREFADILIHRCVAKCTIDPIYYGNPDTLICVTQCPASNYSFGNPLSQECVNYQANGTSGCPVTYFADNFTRLCSQVCTMSTDTYGDNSTWKCVAVCPAGSENTFADNSTMRCVKICPAYPDFYAEPFSRRCVHYCLAPNTSFTGSFSDNSTRLCVQTCPSTPDYFSDNSTGRCVYYCPRLPLTFADNSTRRCVSVCPSIPDIYGDLKSLRCIEKCPVLQETFADYTTRLCVKTCPASPPLYAENISQRCLAACPNNSYADNYTRRCVAVCPRYPETYSDPSSNRCVITCPATPDLYADPVSHFCVPNCLIGFFAENTTRRCLTDCPTDLINYADNLTWRCVLQCPASEWTYGDNSTQRCVKQCPQDPFTYADNMTQKCLVICNNVTGGGYADNVSRICVAKCPNYSYGDITTRYCVRYCPVGWFAYDIDNLCLRNCPTPYFADNTTWRCVRKCPVGQNLFGSSFNNTCVPVCPNGTYASLEYQECVTRCPNRTQTVLNLDTYGYNSTRECVNECPYAQFGYPVSQVCVDECPNPYYKNYTDHLCYACPDECASCTHFLTCLTCIANHYLYSGACVESCPTFPVITYANPNRVCGTAYQCTQGYYALNATKSCVPSCPGGFFINIAGQSCDACLKGCINCNNGQQCLTCNSNVSVWSDYKCYMFCSALKRFFYTSGCVVSCPNGTYLNLTTCQPCSSTCKTCTISAQNCQICNNGYYRSNGICVSQCPSGTTAQAVSGTQTCVSCSIAKCEVQPLTFTTTQFVDNFKYNVQIQFSQPVNITEEINKVIQIQQKKVGRLLEQTYQYLDYTIIDYGNGLYSFVLNNYTPGSNSQLEIQIVNPAAIQGANGQIPQTTRSSFAVDASSIYSLDTYNSGVDTIVLAIGILAFIMLLLTFWTDHSIWMPMYDFMQLMMVMIFVNVSFPPNLMYSLKQSFSGVFAFLPNLFTSYFSQAVYDPKKLNNNIYSVMQDAAFLRTMGHLYILLAIFIVVVVVIWAMSKKLPHKEGKAWAKGWIKETFWRKHLHGLVYLLFLPVFAWGIFNMRLYKYLGSSGIQLFSIISSYIFMGLLLAAVIYFCVRLKRVIKESPVTYLMIQKAYNFIFYQKTVLLNNSNHFFTHEKNEVDLTNAREPRINELLVFPYPIETRIGPWDVTFPLFSYLFKLLIALFLAFSFDNPVIQLILMMLVKIALLVYIGVRRPMFKVLTREYNNEIYMHNLIILLLVELILLIMVFLQAQLTSAVKVLVGNVICALFIEGLLVNIVYFYFRTYNYYHHNFWKRFVRSDVFRINYTLEHLEWTAEYDKEEQKLKSEVKNRQEFLEAIKVETGQALANMIAREQSLSTNTKERIKALQLRPNNATSVGKEFAELFTNLAQDKEKSHKSIASSERLSKKDRKKVRDLIFAERGHEKDEQIDYHQLELIDEKSEDEKEKEKEKESVVVMEMEDEETEYEFEYIDEEYPEGTPMQEMLKGCKKGDVILPL